MVFSPWLHHAPGRRGAVYGFLRGHPKKHTAGAPWAGAPAVWGGQSPGRYTSVMVTSMLPRVALE